MVVCILERMRQFNQQMSRALPSAAAGILKGFDPLLNLVLDDTVEYLRGTRADAQDEGQTSMRIKAYTHTHRERERRVHTHASNGIHTSAHLQTLSVGIDYHFCSLLDYVILHLHSMCVCACFRSR